ncbi:hypothetical protein [uncultured Helicobacter sp.]|uniref:hypothetical protein n=1 Tax=uncultured Helicobacter sp. TaxID=175537 RepID=UPI002638880C|nr:hypothetical protein [uncultured Helicobacter sp.]
MLFGSQEVNAKPLSSEEMKETQGEFWGAASVVISGTKLIYDIGRNNGWWK